MKFPLTYTLIIALLAVILIISYPIILAGNAEKLWGPIRGRGRMVYYVSIGLVLLGFLPFAYFLLQCRMWSEDEVRKIFGALVTLIVFSWLWIVLAIWFSEKRIDRMINACLIFLVLLIVALSILYLISVVEKHFEANPGMGNRRWGRSLIYTGLGYAFFHTFFLDFILWFYLVVVKGY
jgi:hypothetical protein